MFTTHSNKKCVISCTPKNCTSKNNVIKKREILAYKLKKKIV